MGALNEENNMGKIKTDVCVIGAGSGGLSFAAGAAQMGARVVLVEHGEMGGDCLNTGCVPSKALIAAAEIAHNIQQANHFGIDVKTPHVDYARVHQHIRHVIDAIAPNDSIARFEEFGVRVIRASGQFIDKKTLRAGEHEIQARRFVIATGSHATVPPIPGLDQTPFLTNETLFDLKEQPAHLIIIGGGPIGCEMAQAHRRLGSRVSILDHGQIMPKDDPALVEILRRQFINDGIELHENIDIVQTNAHNNAITVSCKKARIELEIQGSHLLVAAGRKPNLEALQLHNAKIEHTPRGIAVNRRLRSISNRRVYAIGDVAGGYQFTHAASYHAGIALVNILFGFPAKVKLLALPWCTYVDPELAHVGLQADEAKKAYRHVRVLSFDFKDNDRAQAQRQTQGKIQVVVDGKKGTVLGCNILGPHAGELILPWVLAVQHRMKISAIAQLIAPYPTLSEISKRVAGSYYTARLYSSKMRRIVRFLQWLLP
jgi:pyruvate/2-oxoglutarate dehydrogenase complex dihydrolipoamide dehydrogenase (E3) component